METQAQRGEVSRPGSPSQSAGVKMAAAAISLALPGLQMGLCLGHGAISSQHLPGYQVPRPASPGTGSESPSPWAFVTGA